MPENINRERLADLLIDPRENLDFEIKNWLDLEKTGRDIATFAKSALALANHGGGFIVFGFEETDRGAVEAEGRPETLDGYSQDLVNGIVQNYCDPPFHCEVYITPNPDAALFPIVRVPGGHRVPVRARRAGPHGNVVENHAIYIRKPGPRSETPQNSRDWDDLLARCLNNRRDEMYDQIRDLIAGAVPQADQAAEPERLEEWIRESFDRWEALSSELPDNAGPRCPNGYYRFAYEIAGDPRQFSPAQLPDLIKASKTRYSGWPPFWYPMPQEIAPYQNNGAVECWIGGDVRKQIEDREASRSDFWRVRPDGLAFLLTGYREDDLGEEIPGRAPVPPATLFDIPAPIWRVGETLLQAERLAANLFEGPTTIRFNAAYTGLSGRTLGRLDRFPDLLEGKIARQDSITLDTHVETQRIDPNLPEIVHPLLSRLYALFGFFELPFELVVVELAKMRGRDH